MKQQHEAGSSSVAAGYTGQIALSISV